ncbi:MAG: peroxiredoxin [Alphaproteobacteria bacterium]
MSGAIKVGGKAPGFDLPADGGGTLSLGDLAGKSVVLYFYPKDDTAGCTKQAIGFSDWIKAFRDHGAAVIGVSKDPVKNHDKFIKKHELSVRLISDAEGSLCENYGVWVEKSMYGRKYMGIERSTFLIDANGTVQNVWRKVRVPGHVEDVLAAVEAL